PRAMKGGAPPTLRKARTGELTPPGIDCWARSKRAAERVWLTSLSYLDRAQRSACALDHDNRAQRTAARALDHDNRAQRTAARALDRDNRAQRTAACALDHDNRAQRTAACALDHDNRAQRTAACALD